MTWRWPPLGTSGLPDSQSRANFATHLSISGHQVARRLSDLIPARYGGEYNVWKRLFDRECRCAVCVDPLLIDCNNRTERRDAGGGCDDRYHPRPKNVAVALVLCATGARRAFLTGRAGLVYSSGRRSSNEPIAPVLVPDYPALAAGIFPLPWQSLQLGEKTRRPGRDGGLVVARPVPSQPGQSCSTGRSGFLISTVLARALVANEPNMSSRRHQAMLSQRNGVRRRTMRWWPAPSSTLLRPGLESGVHGSAAWKPPDASEVNRLSTVGSSPGDVLTSSGTRTTRLITMIESAKSTAMAK